MKTLDFIKKYKGNNFNCVYRLIDNNEVVYVGSTIMPHSRINVHLNGDKVFDSVSYFAVNDGYGAMLNYESFEIVKHNPKYNTNLPYNDDYTLRSNILPIIESKIKSLINEIPVVYSRRSSAYVKSKHVKEIADELESNLIDFINKLHAKECKLWKH